MTTTTVYETEKESFSIDVLDDKTTQPCRSPQSASVQDCLQCPLRACVETNTPHRSRVFRYMAAYETWKGMKIGDFELDSTALAEEAADEFDWYLQDYVIPDELFEWAVEVEMFLQAQEFIKGGMRSGQI